VGAARPASESAQKEALEQRVEAHARFAAGSSYELRGEPELALQQYYLSALADPSNDEIVLDVSRRLFRNRDWDKAITLLTKAGELPAAKASVFALQGLAYAQLGKTNLAVAANRKAIVRNPKAMGGYRNLVNLHLEMKQPREALKVLEEAAAQVGTEAGPLLDLAEMFGDYLSAQPAEAAAIRPRVLGYLDRVGEAKPSNAAILARLADDYRAVGEYGKASGYYLDLMQRFPEFPGLREHLIETYLRSKNYKEAAAQLELIIRNNPTNPQAYLILGGIAMEEKQYERAVDYLEKAMLVLSPEDPRMEQAHYDLANTQISLNQPEKAEATLAQARKQFKVGFLAEYRAGLLYTRLKQYPKAIRHFTSAELMGKTIATNQVDHVFYFQFGAALERNKDLKEAEQYFRKCLELEPEFADALNYLGYMWAERGENLSEARGMIERAVKLEPENGAFLDSLAWVYHKLGRHQEALDWQLKALIHIDEPDSTLYEHLGDIYLALKQVPQAREAWEKALKIEPTDEIRKKLQALPSPGTPLN
jgi:tetratricopeptide (TPR) repeat protein